MKTRSLPRFLTLAMLPLLLLGCEAIFTYTPLEFLQRSPANLSAAGRLTYGENALASGDTQAMIDAYNALSADTSDQAQYLAAQLAIQISGVSDLLLSVATGSTPLPAVEDSASLTAWITENGNADTITYLEAAGEKLNSIDDTSTLTAMDYVYGSLGLALEAASSGDSATLDSAKNLMSTAISSLSTDDPSYSFLNSYNTYLQAMTL
jgi:hypothetical protein